MSFTTFAISAIVAWAAIFVLVVRVHEFGHAAVALIYGRRIASIRILNVVLRVRKRRGKNYRLGLRFVQREPGDHGEVRSAKPRSRSEDIIFSMAGLASEAALLFVLVNSSPWQTSDANNAWHLAVLINVYVACYVALSSAEPGNDLHFALRALRQKRRRRRTS